MNTKLKEFIRAVKFTIISISAGLIQIGSFALFFEVFKWIYWPSYLISLLLSIIWNFTINRKQHGIIYHSMLFFVSFFIQITVWRNISPLYQEVPSLRFYPVPVSSQAEWLLPHWFRLKYRT